MMTPEEKARMDMYKHVFVEKDKLNDILNAQGDRVVTQLRPELKSINKQLKTGHDKFEKQQTEIHEIKVGCGKRHGFNGSGSPTRTPVEHYKVPSTDIVTEEGIKKKTAVVIAIVTGAILVVGTIILGFIYLKSLLPF